MRHLQDPVINRRRTGGYTGGEILVLLGVIIGIWFAVTKISTCSSQGAKQDLYETVWESSPQLKRNFEHIEANLDRLNKAKSRLQKMKKLVEQPNAIRRADHEIGKLDAEIQRVTVLRNRVIGATEEIALKSELSSVTTDLAKRAISDLTKEVDESMAYSSDLIKGLDGAPERKTPSRPTSPRPTSPRPTPSRPTPSKPAPPRPAPSVVKNAFPTATRTWTRFTGEKILAKVTTFNATKLTITIERSDGKEFKNFSLWRLSKEDQRYILRTAGVSH